jgi:hypothetical protein
MKNAIKILNEIEDTDLVRVEINHMVQIINKENLKKLMEEEKE